jgi:outer membrane receptor protein involved in Fe transport
VYDYTENIAAGFINYQGKILKTAIQLGLRGEYTHYTGKLYDTSYSENGKNYFGLFPTVFLKRDVDKKGNHNISFNYSRRTVRPAFGELNPHISYVDNYTLGAGNPFLQPEFDNAITLNYTLKNKYVLTTNYTHANNIIINGVHPNPDNAQIIIQQPVNAGNMQKYMASVFFPFNITKWWTTQAYIEYSNVELKNKDAFTIQKNLITLNTNMQFSIAKNFVATLHAHWFNNYIFANTVLNQMWQADIGLQKKFFKQRFTLKVAADDVFNTVIPTGMVYYNKLNMNFTDKQQTQKITIGFSYNFNAGKIFSARKIESSSEEEKSRLK